MYYREFLRARRSLLIFGVVLGCLVALQIISNISQNGGLVEVQSHHSGNDQIPLSVLFAVAGIAATIFGGILGSSLSSENSGHLELAWTKPASRDRYAMTVMAVDIVAIFGAFLLTLVVTALVIYLAGVGKYVHTDSEAWQNLARFLALPLAWFALIQALTASLRERGGMVSGLAWVGALVLLGLGAAQLPPFWSALIKFINYFNPIAYGAYNTGTEQAPYPFAGWVLDLVGLLALGILGIIIALTQWRRLEA
jgi:hypothetical protein